MLYCTGRRLQFITAAAEVAFGEPVEALDPEMDSIKPDKNTC